MEELGRLTKPTKAVITSLETYPTGVWGLALAKELGLFTGTIYPILARLENLGWVVGYWELDDSRQGPRRRYYRLTEDGILAARKMSGQVVRLKNFEQKPKNA